LELDLTILSIMAMILEAYVNEIVATFVVVSPNFLRNALSW
jgi:hypothetical protein